MSGFVLLTVPARDIPWSAREQAVYSRTWQRITFSAAFYTDWNKNVHYETAGDTLQDYPIFPNYDYQPIYPTRGVFQYIRWMDFNVGFNGRVNYAYDWGSWGKAICLAVWNGIGIRFMIPSIWKV